MTLKATIQDPLPASYHRMVRKFKIWRMRNDLNALAAEFKTDKWGSHWYTQHYDRYFRPLKDKRLNILEIGIGGEGYPHLGGESLRMWKAYFRRSQIVGIDLYDKSKLREARIDTHRCSQDDSQAFIRLSNQYGGFDIIIDDGSHMNEHVIKTFHTLFPIMRPNGIYVVEDIQTSYWRAFGGGLANPHTSMQLFKSLTDGLNHSEYPIEGYEPNYFDKNIAGIAFFHNLVFILKGKNDEKTNAPHLLNRELDAAANDVYMVRRK